MVKGLDLGGGEEEDGAKMSQVLLFSSPENAPMRKRASSNTFRVKVESLVGNTIRFLS